MTKLTLNPFKKTRASAIVTLLLILVLTACVQPSRPVPAAATRARTVTPQPIPTATTTMPSTQPPTQPAGAPSLLQRPCDVYLPKGEVAGETIHCGHVRVPWDREDPDGATSDLAYVILKATGSDPQPHPIVHISGGPGIGATLREVVPEMIKRYAPLRQDHDIILYDQRGMGHSIPFFACSYPNETQAVDLQDELAASTSREISEADVQAVYCQQELAAQGFPASGISTANSAADLADIMIALGYPTYNLYAISYGTRLAMSLMHFFPDDPLLRSIVLDSTYPLPEDKVNDFMAAPLISQQMLFEAVFQACADDPDCVKAFPDLRTRFDALVTKLDAAPLELDDGQTFGGEDLYRLVYPFNQALNYIPYQPRLIAELEQSDTTTLMLLRSGQVSARDAVTGVDPDVEGFSGLMDAFLACTEDIEGGDMDKELVPLWDADTGTINAYVVTLCPGDQAAAVNELLDSLDPGAFNGIIARFAPDPIQGVNSALNIKLGCTEQYPFREDPQAIEAILRTAGLPDFFVDESLADMTSLAEGCEAWADALTQPTPSTYGNYPVMILSGQFDNITPREMADIAAAELPHGQLISVPNAIHSILGNHGDCPTQMVQQFLVDPNQPVDTSCAAGMQVHFLPPETTNDS